MSFLNLRKSTGSTRSPCASLTEQELANLTLESITSESNAGKNFWNLKGYKSALKRCDDGYKCGEKLKECVAELAEIEDSYGKALKKWDRKWSSYLNTESTEYNTGKDAWTSLLKTGSDIASVHDELSDKLTRSGVDEIKKWLDNNYKKSFVSFKRTKEFEKEFQDAQKSWEVALSKLKEMRDDYFQADKKVREAETLLNTKYSGADCNTVMKREAEAKIETTKAHREKSEKLYKKEIEQVKLCEPKYRSEMQSVFDDTQLFEEARLKFFKQIYSSCMDILMQQAMGDKMEPIFLSFSETIEKFDCKSDLEHWSKEFGTGMQLCLPKFEVPLY